MISARFESNPLCVCRLSAEDNALWLKVHSRCVITFNLRQWNIADQHRSGPLSPSASKLRRQCAGRHALADRPSARGRGRPWACPVIDFLHAP